MILKKLELQNFRNYKKASFKFDKTNIIIGRNTIGKTNILEAIYAISFGKSFRAEKDIDTIKLGEDFAKIFSEIEIDEENIKLEVIFSKKHHFSKKFLVNQIPRRQVDFTSKLTTVLFTPEDLEIITDSPSLRRKYFNNILYQADKTYRMSFSIYEKALRQRNRLLDDIKDGRRRYKEEEFHYWNNLLVENGSTITEQRKNFVDFINSAKKEIFDLQIFYDKSTITYERIGKYQEVEQKTGITLIGPQRDEFFIYFPSSERLVKEFGSRGEQRLAILQLKMLEIEYLKNKTLKNPILLLDDIFSELDGENIKLIINFLPNQQTVITTTHMEFIPKNIKSKANLINLPKA